VTSPRYYGNSTPKCVFVVFLSARNGSLGRHAVLTIPAVSLCAWNADAVSDEPAICTRRLLWSRGRVHLGRLHCCLSPGRQRQQQEEPARHLQGFITPVGLFYPFPPSILPCGHRTASYASICVRDGSDRVAPPSPATAGVRRSAGRLLPPIHCGGCGLCTGTRLGVAVPRPTITLRCFPVLRDTPSLPYPSRRPHGGILLRLTINFRIPRR